MSFARSTLALVAAAGAVAAAAAQPLPPPDRRTPVIPAEATKVPPGGVVTVQFRVATATGGRFTGEKADTLVALSPPESLPDGARFEVLLTGKAAVLPRPGPGEGPKQVDQVYENRVVRVTGRMEALGPDGLRTYRLVACDPADVTVFGAERR
jgi:hypothetical protein